MEWPQIQQIWGVFDSSLFIKDLAAHNARLARERPSDGLMAESGSVFLFFRFLARTG
jgi:hypothetical protein